MAEFSEYEKLKKENEELRKQVLELQAENKGLTLALEHIQKFTSQTQQAPQEPVKKEKKQKVQKDPYEALLSFKAKHNKRELLKQKILSMITENGISLAELKFMFVEHFSYCSKATFYNYLKELELEHSITMQRKASKNYIYLKGIIKEIPEI